MEICFQITAVTNYKRPAMHPNYTEVIIDPPYNHSDCKFEMFISDSLTINLQLFCLQFVISSGIGFFWNEIWQYIE